MDSEENLTREAQNLEKNISVGNSLPLKNTPKKPIEKQTQSQSVISSENNQKISNENTQSFINIALKDLQLSREKLEKELDELSKKKVQIET